MFKSSKDYLKKKTNELDLGRGDSLKAIQERLEALYPHSVHVNSLNGGTLKITTKSAAVASELRLRQIALVDEFNQQAEHRITRLHIQIGSI
jgi:hypothetical protein